MPTNSDRSVLAPSLSGILSPNLGERLGSTCAVPADRHPSFATATPAKAVAPPVALRKSRLVKLLPFSVFFSLIFLPPVLFDVQENHAERNEFFLGQMVLENKL